MSGNQLDRLQLNFEEVEPPLSSQEAFEEASRCLYCYDAPCITACPTGIDIPSFIKKVTTDNLLGSARTIMEANPVGASCARVCPTEELCEGACVFNGSTKPILIGKLQRYATDWAIHNEKILFKAGRSKGKSVAIVGGGPAGLSAARELAVMGYEVVIYEAAEEAGGLNTYGIVSFRLPKQVSFWEVEQVKSVGVTIHTNTRVGKDIEFSTLTSAFDAVIVAIGMSSVPLLQIDGENLEGVYDAIDFVKATKNGELTEQFFGKRGVVIGAGNTAIDGATCAIRLGAETVKVLYRRTVQEMTAYDFEYEFAKQDGVEFRWLTNPTKITGDASGKVQSITCVKMELGEPDKDGRRRSVPTEVSYSMQVDFVIRAIGQSRYTEWLHQAGIKTNQGVIVVDPDTLETSASGVFACGDAIFGNGQGEAMVVSAAEQGKQTAYGVHQKLLGQREETNA
ncbi:NAD(P)-dependent oxidoreductase [Alkalicoccobacillus murimartini]|uniref:Glutamate synthase (NADPH/NADH) small chain n=1 Tax=Alkalicoccobacillus murimartini TaxID=171685 RepID=A0ABT9YHU4_9BACI|nr:NAD(P)-dependent oxidoreductase [Alkalicoccobacillus murimartini]MDQ0207281.1 glutamate synthase (NADPH/NADH) small chain [Alkalicoccobacillus murimartini]